MCFRQKLKSQFAQKSSVAQFVEVGTPGTGLGLILSRDMSCTVA